MTRLLKLREETRNKILHDRSIFHIICKPQFEVLWENSNSKKKEEAIKLVYEHNKEGLLNWIKTHPSISPSEMSQKQLVALAKKLRIPNYCRLIKIELIAKTEKALKNE